MTNKINESTIMLNLEREIINEKLADGINGVEWLVLNYVENTLVSSKLNEYFDYYRLYGFNDIEQIMLDALSMNSVNFENKYDFNWDIAVMYILVHLYNLKKSSYNRYFDFLIKLPDRGSC